MTTLRRWFLADWPLPATHADTLSSDRVAGSVATAGRVRAHELELTLVAHPTWLAHARVRHGAVAVATAAILLRAVSSCEACQAEAATVGALTITTTITRAVVFAGGSRVAEEAGAVTSNLAGTVVVAVLWALLRNQCVTRSASRWWSRVIRKCQTVLEKRRLQLDLDFRGLFTALPLEAADAVTDAVFAVAVPRAIVHAAVVLASCSVVSNLAHAAASEAVSSIIAVRRARLDIAGFT